VTVPRATADCGSCERFIGPALTCPYCGAEASPRAPLRLLRIAALAFAVGGLALLFVLAHHRTLPSARIGDITPAMSTARIRVCGDVLAEPRVWSRQEVPNYVSFDLSDGSGVLAVAASRAAARELVAGRLLPRQGDRVEVDGTLTLDSRGRLRLYLDAAAALRTIRPAPPPGTSTSPSVTGPGTPARARNSHLPLSPDRPQD